MGGEEANRRCPDLKDVTNTRSNIFYMVQYTIQYGLNPVNTFDTGTKFEGELGSLSVMTRIRSQTLRRILAINLLLKYKDLEEVSTYKIT